MTEAVKFWNEPNSKSRWDPNLDPERDEWPAQIAEIKAVTDKEPYRPYAAMMQRYAPAATVTRPHAPLPAREVA